MKPIFITGNQNKANFLNKYLGFELQHKKVDLDEVQSLDLKIVAEHKARQAYEIVKQPVLVEDIGFSLDSLGGKLPGPFVKWFIEEVGLAGICEMLNAYEDRGATTDVCYAFFDGEKLKLFYGKMHGQVPASPIGDDGFGWNSIFIPDGQTKTNAEMNEIETEKFSLRTATVYPEIKKFLELLT